MVCKNLLLRSCLTFAVLVVLTALPGCEASDEAFQWLTEESTVSETTPDSTAEPDSATDIQNNSELITDNFTIQVNDVVGESDFIFETLETVSLFIYLQNSGDSALVRISETSGDRSGSLLFQGVPDENGNVTGNFTINTSTDEVLLEVVIDGQTFKMQVDVTNVLSLNRELYLMTDVTPVVTADTDGDGVDDDHDQFPEDPELASVVHYPSESGSYTVAFEDLYPVKGDADFNDYVISVSFSEYLDAAGRVKQVDTRLQHLAKEAGYRHTLHMEWPAGIEGEYNTYHSTADGAMLNSSSGALPGTVEILPESNRTISQSNAVAGQEFIPGERADFTAVFSEAVEKNTLGPVPYGLFIRVKNTGREVHFAGRHYDADGNDLYLDEDGFPWAVLIPVEWDWMLKGENVFSAYPAFESWYQSEGTSDSDWYLYPEEEYVFSR